MTETPTALALKNSKGGFSLIEAAIVLAIVGLVIGGLWLAASTVSENRKQSRFLEQIGIVTRKIIELYHGLPVPASQMLSGNILEAIFPTDMLFNHASMGLLTRNPWDLGFNTQLSSAGNIRLIQYTTSMPVTACMSIGPRLYQSLQKLGGPYPLPRITNADSGNDVTTPASTALGCAPSFAGSKYVTLTVSVYF